MDIGTGLALFGAKDLLLKLLGPTADYLGEEAKTFAERRVHNVRSIFSSAANKLGDRIDLPGSIPPRVLRHVLDEGSFCDDELTAEYMGGVLASSRSGVSRDDRGAAYLGLIARLSAYQIRTHYLLYKALKELFDGSGADIGYPDQRAMMMLYVPYNSYDAGMEFDESEDLGVILAHSLVGLQKEDLIDAWQSGAPENLRRAYAGMNAPDGGLVFEPSIHGVELALWAHGDPNVPVSRFLLADVAVDMETDVALGPGFRKLSDIRERV